jgi:hypothetical protein
MCFPRREWEFVWTEIRFSLENKPAPEENVSQNGGKMYKSDTLPFPIETKSG